MFYFRVFALISSKLLKWSNSLNELTSEIKEYYLVAVKKAIVDFVLQDSSKAKDKVCIIYYIISLNLLIHYF